MNKVIELMQNDTRVFEDFYEDFCTKQVPVHINCREIVNFHKLIIRTEKHYDREDILQLHCKDLFKIMRAIDAHFN